MSAMKELYYNQTYGDEYEDEYEDDGWTPEAQAAFAELEAQDETVWQAVQAYLKQPLGDEEFDMQVGDVLSFDDIYEGLANGSLVLMDGTIKSKKEKENDSHS